MKNLASTLMSRRDALRFGGLCAAGYFLRARGAAANLPTTNDPCGIVSHDGRFRAVVNQAEGANLLALSVKRDGAWIDLSPYCTEEKPAMKSCSWMMLPYSNRIENGAFRFEGRDYQLQNSKGHAIHGDAKNHPWKVEAWRTGYLKCTQRSSDFPGFNWPWPVEFTAEFLFEDNAFVQRLAIRNRGTTAMPAGFGWHPYYNRTLTVPGEPVLLQMSCSGVYPDTNGNFIPSGPAAKPTADFDFSKARAIPTDRKFDHCFSGYDGKGTIEWPRSAVKIAYECSANVTHLVFYSPPDKPWFAVEPAANANNGVNLLARGDPTHGVITLPAGEELTASFTTRVTA